MLKDEIVMGQYSQLLRSAIDVKLNTEDSSFSNSIGLKLTKNKLLVWLNEPSEAILNTDFKNRIEQIASTVLYPEFIVKHKAGLTLIPRYDQPPENARALAFELHYGIYQRLKVNSLNDTNVYCNGSKLAIGLMKDYYWQPSISPHMAIQSVTRGGKTTFLRFLEVNTQAYSRLAVKNGAIDDSANSLIVIDPKLDADLRETTLKLKGIYLCPNFSKSDNSFIDAVCEQLKKVVNLMRNRAEQKKINPKIRFKDVFLYLDEAITLSSYHSKNYTKLLDRILLMSASFQIHCLTASQSFLSGSQGAVSSQGRLEYTTKILITPRVTSENAQFLFKELDNEAISNLILDEDQYGTLGVGIVTNGDGNIVPFKAPFVESMRLGNE